MSARTAVTTYELLCAVAITQVAQAIQADVNVTTAITIFM